MMPILGIAMAAFEPKVPYFFEQLKSIQEQSFKDWLCVVSFDSPMKSFEQCPEFSVFFSDSRFLFVENETTLGHKKNFEKATKTLLGYRSIKFIAFSDQDDLWYPDKLKVSLEKISQSESIMGVTTNMHLIKSTLTETQYILNESGNKENAWDYEGRMFLNLNLEFFILRNIIAGASVVFRRKVFENNRDTIPDCYEYHDYWYATAAISLGTIESLSECFYAYRQHSNNVVGVSKLKPIFSLPNLGLLQTILLCKKRYLEMIPRLMEVKKISPDFHRNSLMCLLAVLFSAISLHDKRTTRVAIGLIVGYFFNLLQPLKDSNRLNPN